MIEVQIIYQGSYIQSFTVTGHAGFDSEGEDIYCAGVSAVTQTALLGLIEHLGEEPVYKIEKGVLDCKLPAGLSSIDREKAQVILSTMEKGLRAMEQEYTGYMKVLVRRS